MATALPPAFSILSLAAFNLSARRATSATAAPLAASTSAKRRPKPPDAPVTSATRPLRSNSSAAFMLIAPHKAHGAARSQAQAHTKAPPAQRAGLPRRG